MKVLLPVSVVKLYFLGLAEMSCARCLSESIFSFIAVSAYELRCVILKN